MPVAVPIPTPAAADSTGLPDSSWISNVRNKLRDQPAWTNGTWLADGSGGVGTATSAPFTLHSGPVWDGQIRNAIQVFVRDTFGGGTNYTVIESGTPTGAQVLVNYDAKTLTWATAPTTGHSLAFGWYTVKWTDAAIEAALYAGLRQMFPMIGKTYVDATTQIAVNQWDYTLPAWAQSPDAVIRKVEVQDPAISVEPWRPLDSISDWTNVGNGQIHVNRAGAISPVGKLRITGWGPFMSLSDLPPDLYNLPIWYAGSVLLPWQESYRIRQDTAVPLTQEGGQSPGILTQTGDYYQKRFDAELKTKKRAYGPPGASRPMTTTYRLARHL